MITELKDDDASEFSTILFAIALDVFAFCTNIWFGIVFLILSFIILMTLNDKSNHCTMYTCLSCIVLFNIGTAIWGELDILLHVLPSLIAIFVLYLVEGSVGRYLHKRNVQLEKEREIQDQKRKQQEYRQKYVTEDMERIEKLLGIGKYGLENLVKGRFTLNQEVMSNRPLSVKINELEKFNNELQNKINENVAKADKMIGETYKSVLRRWSTENLFWNYENISQQYSSALNNPVLAAACDAYVKKVSAFVQQKQDIINKNNVDITKYNQLIQKLQKQYDDELALNKIKELNKDVNSQMEDISDIENKEIKNSEFKSIISDIDLLDREVNERRQYEIQFGQIEI